MTIRMKRIFVVLLSIAIAAAFSVTLPANQVMAKSKKVKAPKKIMVYVAWDGKWKKAQQINISYNKKKDIKKLVNYWYDSAGNKHKDSDSPMTCTYTYKKGTKVKANVKFNDDDMLKYTFKSGKITRLQDDDSSWVMKYGKKGSLKSIVFTDGDQYRTWFKFKPTIKKGKVTRLVVSKKLQENGDTSYKTFSDRKYNKKGLMTKDTKEQITCSYKMKKKLVKYMIYKDNYLNVKYKIVFSYGKTKIPASRYYKMINLDERVMLNKMIDWHHENVTDWMFGDD